MLSETCGVAEGSTAYGRARRDVRRAEAVRAAFALVQASAEAHVVSREPRMRHPWHGGIPVAPVPPPPIPPGGIPPLDPSLAEGLEGLSAKERAHGTVSPTIVQPLDSDDPTIRGRSLVVAALSVGGGWTLKYEKPWWKVAIDVGRACT